MSSESAELREWVDQVWPELSLNDFSLRQDFHGTGDRAPQWQALHGDAGFRRYFRLASEPPLLAVYAPPKTEDLDAFLKIGQLLRNGGILTPAVAAFDAARGFLLVQDFGPKLLLDVLDEASVKTIYLEALTTLVDLQRCNDSSGVLPFYSQEKLRSEMSLFEQWFVKEMLGQSLSIAESQKLYEVFAHLEVSALAQKQVVVHRDFHSRNLIYRNGDRPGVIDFQDAVIGPVTYDVVSLLRDCYISWPESWVQTWALQYKELAVAAGIIEEQPAEQFLKAFDWMGLQRHIKVLGIFSRLSLRDKKHGYLNDLPRVLYYTYTVAQKYPETKYVAELIERRLMPHILEQAWFDDLPLTQAR